VANELRLIRKFTRITWPSDRTQAYVIQ